MQQDLNFDILIIGSGAAGLTLALRLPKHFRIAMVSKGNLSEGSTLYAQGGISAVLDKTDSTESHIEDTLNAGAGLCVPAAGPLCCRTGACQHSMADFARCKIHARKWIKARSRIPPDSRRRP